MQGSRLLRPEAPEGFLVTEAKAATSGLWDDREEQTQLVAVALKLIEARNAWQSRPRKQSRMAT